MKNFYITTTILFCILFTQAQNVGIGTSTPDTKLDIDGAISMKIHAVSAGATITIPADISIVRITDDAVGAANAISVTSPQEGQMLTIYNADAQEATLGGFSVPASTGVISCVYINSAWRLVSTNQASGSAGGDLTGTYPNPQIASGVIVDADINSSAGISRSKISAGTANHVIVNDGLGNLSSLAPSTSGNVLVSNGTSWSSGDGSGSFIRNQFSVSQPAEFRINGRGQVDGSLFVSQNNATGGGIVLADDGDIVDNNDGWASHRFSFGLRVMNGNRAAGTGVGAQISGVASNPTYFNAGNNVGIGTATPSHTLQVVGNTRIGSSNAAIDIGTDGNAFMEMREIDGSGVPYIDFSNDNTIDFDARIQLTGDDELSVTGTSLRIQSMSAGYVRASASGVLSSSATVPWTDVSGAPAFLTTETDPQVGSNTISYVPRWTGSALETGLIFDNGAIGIGTTTPNKRLTVDYAGLTNSHSPVEFRGAGTHSWGIGLVLRTTGGTDGAGLLFRNRDAKNWQIRGETSGTGFQITEDGGDAEYGSGFGTPRFHVFAGGNVGIGTTAASTHRLDVAGGSIRAQDYGAAGSINVMVGDDTYFTDVDRGDILGLYSASNTAVGGLQLGSNTGSYIFGSGGNIGVGVTNPSRKLEVNNAMKFTNSSSDLNDGVVGTAPFAAGLNIVGINTDGTGRKINFWGSFIQNENPTNNSFIGNTNFPQGIWNSSGNVGIGTTGPSNRLQVAASEGQGIDVGLPNDAMGFNGGATSIRFYGYRDVVSNAIGAKISAERTDRCCGWLSQGTELAFYTNEGLTTSNADNSVERVRIKDNGTLEAKAGLRTERHIRYYKRSRGNGQGGVDDLGNYDMCFLTGTSFRNTDSNVDEDDDYQCNVYSLDINGSAEQNEGENEDFSNNFNWNSRPYWRLYSECYSDCSNTTCTATCINFDY